MSTFESSNEHINKKKLPPVRKVVLLRIAGKKLNSYFFQNLFNFITLTGSYPASHSTDINSIHVYPLNILEQCKKLKIVLVANGEYIAEFYLTPIKDLLTLWRRKLGVL